VGRGLLERGLAEGAAGAEPDEVDVAGEADVGVVA